MFLEKKNLHDYISFYSLFVRVEGVTISTTKSLFKEDTKSLSFSSHEQDMNEWVHQNQIAQATESHL